MAPVNLEGSPLFTSPIDLWRHSMPAFGRTYAALALGILGFSAATVFMVSGIDSEIDLTFPRIADYEPESLMRSASPEGFATDRTMDRDNRPIAEGTSRLWVVPDCGA